MSTQHHIVLDAAKMQGLIAIAKSFNEDHLCLYSGEAEQQLGSVAPWLFSFQLNSNFTEWYLASGGGQNWGIVIESEADMKTLKLHLKKFLRVQTEAGKKLYFRFYDPRILPTFLKSCNTQQLTEFFGPINKFIVQIKNGRIVEYTLSNTSKPQLQQQSNNLFNQIMSDE